MLSSLLLFKPSLQYPDWLESHKNSIPQEELTRYRHQLDIMREICSTFDSESEGDSADVKQQRQQKLLQLMQQVSTHSLFLSVPNSLTHFISHFLIHLLTHSLHLMW